MANAQASQRERTFLEAGFFGFAVLNAIAGSVLIVVPFLVSLYTGSFAFSDYGLGCAGLAFAAGFWGLSWLSRGAVVPS